MLINEPNANNIGIENLSLEEKVSFLSSENSYSLKGIASKGIPSIKFTNESRGCIKSGRAGSVNFNKINFTCFPSFMLASCSFDRELLKEMGETIAKECLSNGISAYIISCSILDSIYYGRGYELLGENPYLVGELVAAFSVGLETYGVFPILSDYPIYIGEQDRMRSDIYVDETYFRERYLLPYEIAISKSNPRAIMAAFCKINGIYATESDLINILKDDYGFNGIVFSEWGGLNDRVKALKAGVDIELLSNSNNKDIINGIEEQVIDEELINEKVKKVIQFIEDSKNKRVTGYLFDKTYNHKVAERIAEESICLLKNDDNILPLSKEDTIAVIGCATNPTIQGKGSSYIPVSIIDDPLYSIREISPSLTGDNIIYSEGYDKNTSEIRRELVYEACRTVINAKTVVMFLGFDDDYVTEGKDLSSVDLPANQLDLIDSVYQYNKNIVVVLNTPTCVNMSWINKVKGIIDVKIPGEAIGPAIANVLFGIVNPSGKLSCAYPSLFPFGYGLSYTEFAYSNIYIDYDDTRETYYISFILENVGQVSGKEIVLLYSEMSDTECKYKRLVGFCKPELEPKEKKKVTFKVHKEDLACYDISQGKKIVYSGSYRFMVCSSEEDVKLDVVVYVEGDSLIEKPFIISNKNDVNIKCMQSEQYTLESTINELLTSRAGKRIYPLLFKWAKEIMGLDKNHPTFTMNMELFLNTPVKRLVHMSGSKLSMQRLQGFIDLCNGKTIVGISKVLF